MTNVTLPLTVDQMPPWVLQLLGEQYGGGDHHHLATLVDTYLELFRRTPVSPAILILRRVNWPALPLQWHPVYLPHIPVHISRVESQQAQERLVRNLMKITEKTEQPFPERELREVLARITGLIS